MTILEQINQDLSKLDSQQLQQVAELITTLNPAQSRKSILASSTELFHRPNIIQVEMQFVKVLLRILLKNTS